VTAAIRRGTGLIADLESLDDGLQALMPTLTRRSESEREAFVARLCDYDAALPDRLRQLIEGLADLVAGLTESDGAPAWVPAARRAAGGGRGHRGRLTVRRHAVAWRA
jgi:hypothetical protein